MARASRVLAALRRDGWVEVRRTGSHRILRRGHVTATFAHHDSEDLGGPIMARIAKDFGYELATLRRMV